MHSGWGGGSLAKKTVKFFCRYFFPFCWPLVIFFGTERERKKGRRSVGLLPDLPRTEDYLFGRGLELFLYPPTPWIGTIEADLSISCR